MLCFAVPGTVAGVSYILAFNNAPLYITGTSIIVIISMVMRDLPIGMRAAIAGLGQLDKSLDEAVSYTHLLEEPLVINTNLSAKERKEKVLSMMAKVGLRAEFYNRYPHMFSGGQRQRIAIARGDVYKRQFLICTKFHKINIHQF